MVPGCRAKCAASAVTDFDEPGVDENSTSTRQGTRWIWAIRHLIMTFDDAALQFSAQRKQTVNRSASSSLGAVPTAVAALERQRRCHNYCQWHSQMQRRRSGCELRMLLVFFVIAFSASQRALVPVAAMAVACPAGFVCRFSSLSRRISTTITVVFFGCRV